MREWETILTQPAVQAFGWALLHSLWQGTVVAILLAGVMMLLRGRAANIRYVVACIALVLMLLLPVTTWWMRSMSTSELEASVISKPLSPDSSTTPTIAAQPQSENAAVNGSQPSWRTRLSLMLQKLLPWPTLAWLIGVLVLSLRLLGGTIYLRRIKSRETRPVEKKWKEKLGLLAGRLQVTKPVRLLESSIARVPMAIGWLRPVILLPTSALTGLTPQQLEAILAHELAHIRRHDYLVNLFQSTVETLLFYHPAVWWVSRRIRIEREYCCDDLAVAVCGDPLLYARALTRVERFRQSTPQLAVAANGGLLMSRIHRLVGIQSKRPPRFRGTLASVFVIALVITFGVGTQRTLISNTIAKANPTPASEKVGATSEAGIQTGSAVTASSSARQQGMAAPNAVSSDDTQKLQVAQGQVTLTPGQQEQLSSEVAEKIKALNSSNPAERAQAACSLGKMGAVEAIPFLMQKLGDDASIGSLKCWGEGTWNPAMETFRNPSTGEQAAIALAAMGEPSVASLINALSEANPSIRRNAAWALSEIRGGHGTNREAAVKPLIALLRDGDASVQKAAAFSLGEIRDERAGEELILALDDSDWQVREMAAWALGEMKDERAVRSLTSVLLKDEQGSVRSKSAWALGEIKASAAVEALTIALNDQDQQVRSYAKWALAEIQDF